MMFLRALTGLGDESHDNVFHIYLLLDSFSLDNTSTLVLLSPCLYLNYSNWSLSSQSPSHPISFSARLDTLKSSSDFIISTISLLLVGELLLNGRHLSPLLLIPTVLAIPCSSLQEFCVPRLCFIHLKSLPHTRWKPAHSLWPGVDATSPRSGSWVHKTHKALPPLNS